METETVMEKEGNARTNKLLADVLDGKATLSHATGTNKHNFVGPRHVLEQREKE